MKKDAALGFMVVVVLLGTLVLYVGSRPTSTESTPTEEVAASGKIEEHEPYHDITVQYATKTPLTGSANAAAVAQMKAFVDEQVKWVKETTGKLTPQDAASQGITSEVKYELRISYVTAASPRTISYIYTIYNYSLGAHGNTDFKTFTFDTQTGRQLGLGDLFIAGAPYVETLTKIARERLPEILESTTGSRDSFDPTTPFEAKSFQHFFLDGTSLVILFPPYAVAAYAAGSQTVAIPISELKDILRSEYQ